MTIQTKTISIQNIICGTLNFCPEETNSSNVHFHEKGGKNKSKAQKVIWFSSWSILSLGHLFELGVPENDLFWQSVNMPVR